VPAIAPVPEPAAPEFAPTLPTPIRAHQPKEARPALAPEPKKRSLLPVLAALVVLGALGGGAFVALSGPTLTATEQLALAEKASGDERFSALEKVGNAEDATEAQLLEAAAGLVEGQQHESALRVLDVALQKNPKNVEARVLEARAALATKKARRLETAVKEAAALAPNDARPDAILAEFREAQGETSGALELWSKAVSKAPGNAHYLWRQGYWLSQSGKLDEAEAALSRSLKKKSPHPEATAELGFVKFRQNEREGAIRLLRSVVKEKPELLEGHYYLASALFQKGDLPGARAEYLAADGLAGADTRPLTALCEMEQMSQTPELPAVQKKIRERFPKDADGLLSKCAAAAP
jgi:tetratricopeptide (TPR) repeat protein